jgi:hypothetical protein
MGVIMNILLKSIVIGLSFMSIFVHASEGGPRAGRAKALAPQKQPVASYARMQSWASQLADAMLESDKICRQKYASSLEELQQRASETKRDEYLNDEAGERVCVYDRRRKLFLNGEFDTKICCMITKQKEEYLQYEDENGVAHPITVQRLGAMVTRSIIARRVAAATRKPEISETELSTYVSMLATEFVKSSKKIEDLHPSLKALKQTLADNGRDAEIKNSGSSEFPHLYYSFTTNLYTWKPLGEKLEDAAKIVAEKRKIDFVHSQDQRVPFKPRLIECLRDQLEDIAYSEPTDE